MTCSDLRFIRTFAVCVIGAFLSWYAASQHSQMTVMVMMIGVLMAMVVIVMVMVME